MDFNYPLKERAPISQRFGENPDWYRRFGLAGHNGLDLAIPAGTPVLAAAPGMVLKTGFEPDGYGRYVTIAHDGNYVSLYAHLCECRIKAAAMVAAGQVIGLSGSTGFSTGPHLHFEIRLNRSAVDPEPLLLPPSSLIDGAGAKPAPAPGAAGVSVAAVTADFLNIRRAPNLASPVIGCLEKGKRITILERSVTVWVKIGKDAWVAHTFNNESYLEEVQT